MNILTDKKYKDYDYFSRYTSFPIYYNKENEKYIYGTTAQINPDTNYSLYKTQRGDTLDSIALNYYNNPTFFWVIARFNNILDPYIKLKENIELKIPVLSDVTFNLK